MDEEQNTLREEEQQEKEQEEQEKKQREVQEQEEVERRLKNEYQKKVDSNNEAFSRLRGIQAQMGFLNSDLNHSINAATQALEDIVFH